jgi:hypothetical protein
MDYTYLNPICSKDNITMDLTSNQDPTTLDPTSMYSTSNGETFTNTVEQSETESKDPEGDFSHLNPEQQAVLSQISKIIRGTLPRC